MLVTTRIKLHMHNCTRFFVCMYVYVLQFVCMNVCTLQFVFGLFSLYLFVCKLQSLRLKAQAGLRNVDENNHVKTNFRNDINLSGYITDNHSNSTVLSLQNQSIYQSYIAHHPHPAQWRSHGVKLQHVYQCKQIIRFPHTL